jgi:Recombination endonuclease VII
MGFSAGEPEISYTPPRSQHIRGGYFFDQTIEVGMTAAAIDHALNLEWCAKHSARRNRQSREWRLQNPEKSKALSRTNHLKKNYGIGELDYQQMLVHQGGCCALCHTTPSQEKTSYLCVDHCHVTGTIRGLLCKKHNNALGMLGDNQVGLERALKYIKGAAPIKQSQRSIQLRLATSKR